MVSSSVVSADAQKIIQEFQSYYNEFSNLNGTWEGASSNNAKNVISQFLSSYRGMINLNMYSFSKAAAKYKEYEEKKKILKEKEMQLSNMFPVNGIATTRLCDTPINLQTQINSLKYLLEKLKKEINSLLANIKNSSFNNASMMNNISMLSNMLSKTSSFNVFEDLGFGIKFPNDDIFENKIKDASSTDNSQNNKDVQIVNPITPDDSQTNKEVKKYSTYSVKYGDTLSNIARDTGLSLSAIIAANPQIKNPDLIYVGDKINIPNNTLNSNNDTNSKSSNNTGASTTKSNDNLNTDSKYKSGKTVSAQLTAYYPADNAMGGGFYDCSGNLLDPNSNTCAAPKEVPLGTKIQIKAPGTRLDGKIYTVTDRGGAIKINSDGSYHFDILMSSNSECNEWGVKLAEVIFLD